MAKRRRSEIRRRQHDGKFIRWELFKLSELGILPMIEVEGKYIPGYYDHTWVVTGVFDTRKEAFKR